MTESQRVQNWRSERFGKTVHLTHHARKRMAQRAIDDSEIMDVLETGAVKQKDAEHWWIYKAIPGRGDNLVCAAVISHQAIIIKTIMTHWEELDG